MPVFYNNQTSGSSDEELILPGVDVAAGVKRFANKKELYFKSLTKFISELPDEFAPFAEFSKEEVRAESSAYIHTIKGVVGNLALIDLYDKTVFTEQFVKTGTLTEEIYAEWIDMVKMTKVTILPLLPNSSAASSAEKKGSISDFINILKELKEPLEFFNSTKCDELSGKVKKVQWDGVPSDFVTKLLSCIDDFEYEEALAKIELFIGKEAN